MNQAIKTSHKSVLSNRKTTGISRQRFQRIYTNTKDRLFNADTIRLSGRTPFEKVFQQEIVTLRYYQPSNPLKAHRTPLVLVPPLAVNMLIYDLFPTRSLVKFLSEQGFHVYLIDWGVPSRQQTQYNFATYVKKFMPNFLSKIREHSGQQQISLHGWSLGGAMALCYTALFKDKDIRNIAVLGAPVNTHKAGYMGKFYKSFSYPAGLIRNYTPWRARHLPSGVFHMYGWQNTLGFKLTDPIGNLKGYWELIKNLHDRDYVVNHATSSSFIDNMLAYPGGVMRDILIRFWIDDELSTGVFPFSDQTAYLKDIHCPILAIAGATDNLVTVNAVKPVLDLVSSEDKLLEVVPGGHMGIVSGSQAPESTWKVTAAWFAERSN